MATYTTLGIVRQRLSFQTTETADDALIGTLILEASAYIDAQANMTLQATIGTLLCDARPPYVMNGRDLFFRDDVFLHVDRIINGDGNAFAQSDYSVYPANTSPKTHIRLNTSAPLFTYGTTPNQAIRVEGTLGVFQAGTVPYDLQLAATLMACYLYLNRNKTGDVVQLADGTTITPQGVSELVAKSLAVGGYQNVRVFF